MKLTGKEKSLLRVLLQADWRQQLRFGVEVSSRLVGNYEALFGDQAQSGVLKNSLEYAINCLFGAEPDRQLIRELLVACEQIAPESNSTDSMFLTSAQDACFSVCAILDFLLEHDATHIVIASRYAFDSVDLIAQELQQLSPSDPNLEQKIFHHPLMKREREFQESALSDLLRPVDIDQKQSLIAGVIHSPGTLLL